MRKLIRQPETPVSYGIYEKYIKMLKTGVPEGAIKLKMELDGVESNVDLRQISKAGVAGMGSGAPPPPPPPPILGDAVGSTRGGGMAGVFADIKKGGGAKLKKVGLPKNSKKKQIQKTGLKVKLVFKTFLKHEKLNKTGSFL